jgi:hypothetical protein
VVCVPKIRFSGFVHYLGEVVGCQLGKWELGENSFLCEHKAMCGKGLGRGIILEKWGASKFFCAGVWINRGERGEKGQKGLISRSISSSENSNEADARLGETRPRGQVSVA